MNIEKQQLAAMGENQSSETEQRKNAVGCQSGLAPRQREECCCREESAPAEPPTASASLLPRPYESSRIPKYN